MNVRHCFTTTTRRRLRRTPPVSFFVGSSDCTFLCPLRLVTPILSSSIHPNNNILEYSSIPSSVDVTTKRHYHGSTSSSSQNRYGGDVVAGNGNPTTTIGAGGRSNNNTTTTTGGDSVVDVQHLSVFQGLPAVTTAAGGVTTNVKALSSKNLDEIVDTTTTTPPPKRTTTTKTNNRISSTKTNNNTRLRPPPLQVAAREGRSAMELVHRTPFLQSGGEGTDGHSLSSRSLDNEQQLQLIRDGISRHRQSLKEAAESLLKATKATGLLADAIADIRDEDKKNKKRSNSRSTTPTTSPITDGEVPKETTASVSSSINELHKAFLSLTQSLLDSLDRHNVVATTTPPPPPITNNNNNSPGRPRRSSSRTSTLVPNDEQLIELLLILSYRSHQLSLPFHWPLYQRMALTLAQQPHISTLRSRAEWIWNIHQWSTSTWGERVTTSSSSSSLSLSREEQLKQKHQCNMEWFTPSLLALAEGQFWSDLSYLLRHVLLPHVTKPPLRKPTKSSKMPSTSSSNHRGTRQKSSRGGSSTALLLSEHDMTTLDTYYSQQQQSNIYYVERDLTRAILLALEKHGIIPNLWTNLRHPSPIEEDVLEVLFLLESSIWRFFDIETNKTNTTPATPKQATTAPGTDSIMETMSQKGKSEMTPSSSSTTTSTTTTSTTTPDNNNSSSSDDVPTFGLREAIEVVLRLEDDRLSNDPYRGTDHDNVDVDDNDDDEEDDYDDDNDYDSFAKMLQDLEELLSNDDKDNDELDDDDDESNNAQRQHASNVVSLAALLLDPTWQGGRIGKHRPLSWSKRIPRDLEVRVTRSGEFHILEVSGLGINDAVNSSSHARQSSSVEQARWNDDTSIGTSFEENDNICTRKENYVDAIPDVTHQLYEHNGNRKVRYSKSLEYEIYQQFQNPSSGSFQEFDEEDRDDQDG